MSVIFEWSEAELDSLLETCVEDEVWPLLKKLLIPGARVLEAGCGAGRWVRFLSDSGYLVTGLEYNNNTVAMVRNKWPDIEVIQGDCEASPFDADTFDYVLSFGVVEHWVDGPYRPLSEIYRILKPGSLAIITVPCMSTIRRFKRRLLWNELLGAPKAILIQLINGRLMSTTRSKKEYIYTVFPAWGEFFEYRMTPFQFRCEVERAGFKVKEHHPLAFMDGIYHELNPFGILVRFSGWKFYPTGIAMKLNKLLMRWRFFHPHMQAIVAMKPDNLDGTNAYSDN